MKIGLSYTGSEPKHQRYAGWLKGGDEDIEVTKLSAELHNFDEIKDCDGLVLSGGIDIFPGLYAGEEFYPHRPDEWRKDRDLFEKSLFDYALAHSMPVLGICRGLQLINVCLGGTLVQDLGDGVLNPIHKADPADKNHALVVKEGTWLGEITGEEKGEVNSAHHQAIDRLADGLQPNCFASDNTIEGIEWADRTGKPFLLGVQWHPERVPDPANPFSVQIRNAFLADIRKTIRP